MTKLTVADIADEILKAFDLDDAPGGLAMEQLHNRVKAQETDPEMATKMLNEGFLAALQVQRERIARVRTDEVPIILGGWAQAELAEK